MAKLFDLTGIKAQTSETTPANPNTGTQTPASPTPRLTLPKNTEAQPTTGTTPRLTLPKNNTPSVSASAPKISYSPEEMMGRLKSANVQTPFKVSSGAATPTKTTDATTSKRTSPSFRKDANNWMAIDGTTGKSRNRREGQYYDWANQTNDDGSVTSGLWSWWDDNRKRYKAVASFAQDGKWHDRPTMSGYMQEAANLYYDYDEMVDYFTDTISDMESTIKTTQYESEDAKKADEAYLASMKTNLAGAKSLRDSSKRLYQYMSGQNGYMDAYDDYHVKAVEDGKSYSETYESPEYGTIPGGRTPEDWDLAISGLQMELDNLPSENVNGVIAGLRSDKERKLALYTFARDKAAEEKSQMERDNLGLMLGREYYGVSGSDNWRKIESDLQTQLDTIPMENTEERKSVQDRLDYVHDIVKADTYRTFYDQWANASDDELIARILELGEDPEEVTSVAKPIETEVKSTNDQIKELTSQLSKLDSSSQEYIDTVKKINDLKTKAEAEEAEPEKMEEETPAEKTPAELRKEQEDAERKQLELDAISYIRDYRLMTGASTSLSSFKKDNPDATTEDWVKSLETAADEKEQALIDAQNVAGEARNTIQQLRYRIEEAARTAYAEGRTFSPEDVKIDDLDLKGIEVDFDDIDKTERDLYAAVDKDVEAARLALSYARQQKSWAEAYSEYDMTQQPDYKEKAMEGWKKMGSAEDLKNLLQEVRDLVTTTGMDTYSVEYPNLWDLQEKNDQITDADIYEIIDTYEASEYSPAMAERAKDLIRTLDPTVTDEQIDSLLDRTPTVINNDDRATKLLTDYGFSEEDAESMIKKLKVRGNDEKILDALTPFVVDDGKTSFSELWDMVWSPAAMGAEKGDFPAEQLANYYYILATKGLSAATDYALKVNNQLTSEYRNEMQKKITLLNDYRADNSTGFEKGLQYVSTPWVTGIMNLTGITDTLKYMNQVRYLGNTIVDSAPSLSEASEWMTENVNRQLTRDGAGQIVLFFNNAYGSAVQSFEAMTIGGSIADFLGITESTVLNLGLSKGLNVHELITTAFTDLAFFGSASSSRYRELVDQGIDPEKAMNSAIVSGICEAAFEHISIETLYHAKDVADFSGIGDVIMQTIIGSGIEGSEEVCTELANFIADQIMLGVEGDFFQSMEMYRDQGMSESEAWSKAVKDFAYKVGEAGAAGFVSGGMSISLRTTNAYVHERLSTKDYNTARGNTYLSKTYKDGKSGAVVLGEFLSDYDFFGGEHLDKSAKKVSGEYSGTEHEVFDTIKDLAKKAAKGSASAEEIGRMVALADSLDTKIMDDFMQANRDYAWQTDPGRVLRVAENDLGVLLGVDKANAYIEAIGKNPDSFVVDDFVKGYLEADSTADQADIAKTELFLQQVLTGNGQLSADAIAEEVKTWNDPKAQMYILTFLGNMQRRSTAEAGNLTEESEVTEPAFAFPIDESLNRHALESEAGSEEMKNILIDGLTKTWEKAVQAASDFRIMNLSLAKLRGDIAKVLTKDATESGKTSDKTESGEKGSTNLSGYRNAGDTLTFKGRKFNRREYVASIMEGKDPLSGEKVTPSSESEANESFDMLLTRASDDSFGKDKDMSASMVDYDLEKGAPIAKAETAETKEEAPQEETPKENKPGRRTIPKKKAEVETKADKAAGDNKTGRRRTGRVIPKKGSTKTTSTAKAETKADKAAGGKETTATETPAAAEEMAFAYGDKSYKGYVVEFDHEYDDVAYYNIVDPDGNTVGIAVSSPWERSFESDVMRIVNEDIAKKGTAESKSTLSTTEEETEEETPAEETAEKELTGVEAALAAKEDLERIEREAWAEENGETEAQTPEELREQEIESEAKEEESPFGTSDGKQTRSWDDSFQLGDETITRADFVSSYMEGTDPLTGEETYPLTQAQANAAFDRDYAYAMEHGGSINADGKFSADTKKVTTTDAQQLALENELNALESVLQNKRDAGNEISGNLIRIVDKARQRLQRALGKNITKLGSDVETRRKELNDQLKAIDSRMNQIRQYIKNKAIGSLIFNKELDALKGKRREVKARLTDLNTSLAAYNSAVERLDDWRNRMYANDYYTILGGFTYGESTSTDRSTGRTDDVGNRGSSGSADIASSSKTGGTETEVGQTQRRTARSVEEVLSQAGLNFKGTVAFDSAVLTARDIFNDKSLPKNVKTAILHAMRNGVSRIIITDGELTNATGQKIGGYTLHTSENGIDRSIFILNSKAAIPVYQNTQHEYLHHMLGKLAAENRRRFLQTAIDIMFKGRQDLFQGVYNTYLDDYVEAYNLTLDADGKLDTEHALNVYEEMVADMYAGILRYTGAGDEELNMAMAPFVLDMQGRVFRLMELTGLEDYSRDKWIGEDHKQNSLLDIEKFTGAVSPMGGVVEGKPVSKEVADETGMLVDSITIPDGDNGPEIMNISGDRKLSGKASLATENTPTAKQSIKVNNSSVTKKTKTDKKGNLIKQTVRELRDEAFHNNREFMAEQGEAGVKKFNSFLDKVADWLTNTAAQKFRYLNFEDINEATLKVDPVSNQLILTSMVKNGEYAVNIDFGTICERRQALQTIMNELLEGVSYDENNIGTVQLNASSIHKINEALRDAGINTQCLICFVETKRYNQTKQFSEFTEMWNNEVKKYTDSKDTYRFRDGVKELTPEHIEARRKALDGYSGYGKGVDTKKAVADMVKRLAKYSPEDLKLLDINDIASSKGRTNISQSFPDLDGLIKKKGGSAAPKPVYGYIPYNGEIEGMFKQKRKGETDEQAEQRLRDYIKSIAGVRSQSFSDFIITHIFDHLQKTGAMAAKGLVAHTYTKVLARAELFGLTGEKINMSLLFDIDPNVDSWYAGLSEETQDIDFSEDSGRLGVENARNRPYNFTDYQARMEGKTEWVQSFPYNKAVEIQNTPIYSKNTGTIGVSHSYWHTMWMLADPEIRQVIGYHSSSYPGEIKKATKLDRSTDYTDVQNNVKIVGIARPNYERPEGTPSYATEPSNAKKLSNEAKRIALSAEEIKSIFGNYANGETVNISRMLKDALADKANKGKSKGEVAAEVMRNFLNTLNDNGLTLITTKAEGGHGSFDLYGDVERTQNPYETMDNFISYNLAKGNLPAFYEFTTDPNYYKLIFDFNVFDRQSYNPETGLYEVYAPQETVRVLDENGELLFPNKGDIIDALDHYATQYDNEQHHVYDFINDESNMDYIREVTGVKASVDTGKYSIETLPDGTQYVWIDSNIVSEAKANNQKPNEYVQEYIENVLEKTGVPIATTPDGRMVYAEEAKRTPKSKYGLGREFTHSASNKVLMHGGLLNKKFRTVKNLDEIISIAQNPTVEETKHPENKDAVNTIRYTSTFAFPVWNRGRTKLENVRAYDCELIMNLGSDGKYYLYDEPVIKENTASAIAILKEQQDAANKAASQNGVSANNIADSDQKVNVQNSAQGRASVDTAKYNASGFSAWLESLDKMPSAKDFETYFRYHFDELNYLREYAITSARNKREGNKSKTAFKKFAKALTPKALATLSATDVWKAYVEGSAIDLPWYIHGSDDYWYKARAKEFNEILIDTIRDNLAAENPVEEISLTDAEIKSLRPDLVNAISAINDRDKNGKLFKWDEFEKTLKSLQWLYKNQPQLNYLTRLANATNASQKKAIRAEFEKMLSGINDRKALWYMSVYSKYATPASVERDTKQEQREKSAQRIFANTIEARRDAINEEAGLSSNIGMEVREYSLQEIEDMFRQLNTDENLNALADKVFPVVEKLGLTIRGVPSGTIGSKTAGHAYGSVIEYNTKIFNGFGDTDQYKATALLHELIHGATSYALYAYEYPGWNIRLTPEMTDAVKKIRSVYNAVATDPELSNMYGAKDVHEMLAELANPKFREALEKKSLWDRIVDAFKQFFGIDTKNALDAASIGLDYLLDNFDYRAYLDYADYQNRAWQENRSVTNKAADAVHEALYPNMVKLSNDEWIDRNYATWNEEDGIWERKENKLVIDEDPIDVDGVDVYPVNNNETITIETESGPVVSGRFCLDPNGITTVTYFAGAGMFDYAIKDRIFNIGAVEFDPQIQESFIANNGNSVMVMEADVTKVDPLTMLKDAIVEYFHASPVCKNFSKANNKSGEQEIDREFARAIVRALEAWKPKVFTLENVKGYIGSDSYNMVMEALNRLGYETDAEPHVYNAKDYGAATSRERLFIRAVLKTEGKLPPLPQKTGPKSWWDAVKDKVDGLETLSYEKGISPYRKRRLADMGIDINNLEKPILLLSGTANGEIQVAEADKPSPTLMTKGEEARIILPGGIIKKVTPEIYARIQGIDDNWIHPKQLRNPDKTHQTNAFKVLGNGIPVELTRAIVNPLLDIIDKGRSSVDTGKVATLDDLQNKWAPMFYSKMENVISEQMPGKMGANQVVTFLKNRGVKDEEIKWSGIVPYLEGKKSVTKDELLGVMAGNELQIETRTLGSTPKFTAIDPITGRNVSFYNSHAAMIRAREIAEEWGLDYTTGYVSARDGNFYYKNRNTGEITEIFQLEDNRYDENGNRKEDFQTHWHDRAYNLPGGENYREILFKLPGLNYSNAASRLHWGDNDAVGTIAHARVDDMDTADGDRVLFVEEIQSDLHNAGSASDGFYNRDVEALEDIDELQEQRKELRNQYRFYKDRLVNLSNRLLNDFESFYGVSRQVTEDSIFDWLSGRLSSPVKYDVGIGWLFDDYSDEEDIDSPENRAKEKEITEQIDSLLTDEDKKLVDAFKNNSKELDIISKRIETAGKKAPEVPYAGSADTYHEYVMKNLLRQAAENGYDAIGWTTAQQQVDRWSDKYAEGYRIEYDQNIPKFMNKYTKQWGGKVQGLNLENGEEVWGVKLTPEMVNSVLYEGQPKYSVDSTAVQALDTIDRNRESVDNVASTAAEHFGTTENYDEAGYILADGRMLDFSGRHWSEGNGNQFNGRRYVDHEDIFEVYEAIGQDISGDNRAKFIDAGNIRFMPEAPGINVSSTTPLTNEQYDRLRDYLEKYNPNHFYVDFEGQRSSNLYYDGTVNPDRVIADIRRVYENGPAEQSVVSRFHDRYSVDDREVFVLNSKASVDYPDVKYGLNFRDPTGELLEKVFDGTKQYETRDYNEKRGHGQIKGAYLNKPMGIVQTGAGQAQNVGYWELGDALDGEPKDYQWLNDHAEELGNDGTEYQAQPGDLKWIYPIKWAERTESSSVTSFGPQARRIRASVDTANSVLGRNMSVPTEDDIKNGTASYGGLPVKYDPKQTAEARNWTFYITVSDKFFGHDTETQRHILNHEVAHNLSDKIMGANTGRWSEFSKAFITEKNTPESSTAYARGQRTYWEGLYGDIGATALSETLTRAITEYLDDPDRLRNRSEAAFNEIQNALNDPDISLDIPEYTEQVEGKYSIAVEDPETLNFLNEQLENGDVVHAYKSFIEIPNEDGTVDLYAPMDASEKDDDGAYKMTHAMKVGTWEESVGNPNSKKVFYKLNKNGDKVWYYNLTKENGDVVPAAYDPYQHSSNVVLNDQFKSAYKRPRLATYEVVIPASELTSGYHYRRPRADGEIVEAALPVGQHPWHKGDLASYLKNTDRQVYLSRWLMPYRKVPDSEVAEMYKDILDKEDTNLGVPFNVVPPNLLRELERVGTPIDYMGTGLGESSYKKALDYVNNNRARDGLDPIPYSFIPSDERKKIRLSPKSNGRFSVDNTYNRFQSTALLKQDTLDFFLSEKGYGTKFDPNYSQAYIGWMSPRAYLTLTTKRGEEDRIYDQGWWSDVNEISRRAGQGDPIYLDINHETGEIEGHEGRHRMMYLSSLGITHVPVVFRDTSNKYDKTELDNFQLWGQFQKLRSYTVDKLIPLNNAHREEIENEFVKGTPLMRETERILDWPIARFSIDNPVDVFGDPVSVDTTEVTNPTVSPLSDRVFYADGNAYIRTEDGSTVVINNVTEDSPEAKYINTLETINNADRTAEKPYTIPQANRNESDGYNHREQDAGLRRGSEEVAEEYQEGTLRRTGSISERDEEGRPQSTEPESVKASLDFSKIPNIDFINSDGEVVTSSNLYPIGSFQREVLLDIMSNNLAGLERTVNNLWSKSNPPSEEVVSSLRDQIQINNALTDTEKRNLLNKLDELINEYGMHKFAQKDPKRGDRREDVHLPLQVNDATKTRKFVQTAARNAIREEFSDQALLAALREDISSYEPISDAKARDYAQNMLDNQGYTRCLALIKAKVESNEKVTKYDIALAELLMKAAEAEGNYTDALQLLADVAIIGTNAGQVVQAMSMVKKLTPRGQLYYMNTLVNRLNRTYEKAINDPKNKMNKIIIPDANAQAVLTARTKEEFDKAVEDLKKAIAMQIPATWADKWNAWRYLAMLGNPRTHVRNLFGNGGFAPAVFIKDLIARELESHTNLVDPEKRSRLAGATFNKNAAYMRFAAENFEIMKDILSGDAADNKYTNINEIMKLRDIWGEGPIGKAFQTASDFNSKMLEKEDLVFLKLYYQRAFAEFLQARGITEDQLNKDFGTTKETKAIMYEAQAWALREAQRNTYRDANAIASTLNQLKHKNKVSYVLLEGLVPFTKTPLNILSRGIEYSPIGLIQSLVNMGRDLRSGQYTTSEVIDRLAAGTTGTFILTALGFILAQFGYLRGMGPDDDKEREFDTLQGHQNWSIEIGNVSYTIDWMAPSALPLFVGCSIHDMLQSDFSAFTVWDIGTSLARIAEPLTALSMLDGLNSTLSSIAAAQENSTLSTLAGSMLLSYVSQGMPTILGQFARSIDPDRRATYVNKNSTVPAALQKFIQKSIQAKVPGWESQKMAYVDEWGRTDSSDTALQTLWKVFENFISPGYGNIINTTSVDEELQRLYEATKDNSVLPNKGAKYLTNEGEKKDFTAKEYEEFSKVRGATAFDLLTEIFSTSDYQELDDDNKKKIIESVYSYADSIAKQEIVPDMALKSKWMETAQAIGPADYILIKSDIDDAKTNEKLFSYLASNPRLNESQIATIISQKYAAPDEVKSVSNNGYVYSLTEADEEAMSDIFAEVVNERLAELRKDPSYLNADEKEQGRLINDLYSQAREDTKTLYGQMLDKSGRAMELGKASSVGKEAFKMVLDVDGGTSNQAGWLSDMYSADKILNNPLHEGYTLNLDNAQRRELKQEFSNAWNNAYKELINSKEFKTAPNRAYKENMIADKFNAVSQQVEDAYAAKIYRSGKYTEEFGTPSGYTWGEAYSIATKNLKTTDEQAKWLAQKFSTGSKIDNPDRSAYEITLTGAQQAEIKEDFVKDFVPRYKTLVTSSGWNSLSEDQKQARINDLQKKVAKDVENTYARKLVSRGYYSEELNTSASYEKYYTMLSTENLTDKQRIKLLKDKYVGGTITNPEAKEYRIQVYDKFIDDNYSKYVKNGTAAEFEKLHTAASNASGDAVKKKYGIKKLADVPDIEYPSSGAVSLGSGYTGTRPIIPIANQSTSTRTTTQPSGLASKYGVIPHK